MNPVILYNEKENRYIGRVRINRYQYRVNLDRNPCRIWHTDEVKYAKVYLTKQSLGQAINKIARYHPDLLPFIAVREPEWILTNKGNILNYVNKRKKRELIEQMPIKDIITYRITKENEQI